MSLFRVREFWSIELEQFAGQNDNQNAAEDGPGSFAASWGRFECIGHHDVFVCANLNGFLCIVQVPEDAQPKCKPDDKGPIDELARANASYNRQLLAGRHFELPIVDLKCGYFTSAIKQSIAILSFAKLIVLQVKRHQAVDLLTSDQQAQVDFDLLSHEFEESYRIDLLDSELATSLVVFNTHSDSILTKTSRDEAHREDRPRDGATDRHGAQQLQLPQRDRILVQYANQFIVSIVEHKKIVGHFNLLTSSDTAGESPNTTKVQPLSLHVGPMPIVYLHNAKSASIVFALSDNRLHSVPSEMLLSLSKQSIVKKVARNLLAGGAGQERSSLLSYNSPSKLDCQDALIDVDLNRATSWTLELPRAPLWMQHIRRGSGSGPLSNELLVGSRYQLDLITGDGRYLWSQRFEAPLLCCYAYLVAKPADRDDSNRAHSAEQRVLSLVCSDSLGADRCNLSILDEDCSVWSACLHSKPMQIWRMSLSETADIIATIDIQQGRLSVNYLGTNVHDEQPEPVDSEAIELRRLESLDSEMFGEEAGYEDSNSTREQLEDRLLVDIKLEASNQWPDVSIDCSISLSSSGSFATGLLQNLVATLEFDEMFQFETTNIASVALSAGAVQLHLGSYWPDRREPLTVRGSFSRLTSGSTGISAMDKVDASEQNFHEPSLLPKSLKVGMYLRYTDAQLGVLVQQQHFLLPLSLIGQLVYLDYSSGLSQSLADVQCNLFPYKRSDPSYEQTGEDLSGATSPYYVCDMILKIRGNLVDLIDTIIESDIICRGLNCESSQRQGCDREQRRAGTFESINLLAQSLNCRLRFKGRPNAPSLLHQSSEDQPAPIVVLSVAMRMPSASHTPLAEFGYPVDGDSPDCLVWLHLCDLSAPDSSIPKQMVEQHMREWKSLEADAELDAPPDGQSVLISIESEFPLPALLLQSHLLDRLQRAGHEDGWQHFGESICDAIEISGENLLKLDNFVAFSTNLHDALSSIRKSYEVQFKSQLRRLRDGLALAFCKFQVAAATSLSMSKRLVDLPEESHERFATLTQLVGEYQLELAGLLQELARLKHLQSYYCRIPEPVGLQLASSGEAQQWQSLEPAID